MDNLPEVEEKNKKALNVLSQSIFKRMKARPALTALLGSLLVNVGVNAGTQALEFNHSETRCIKTLIAKDKPNRITFGKQGILEVIGDSNKYQIINDSQGEQIFITPKVKVGERIDLTIVAASGKAQDLNLTVVKDDARTIIIKDVSSSESSKAGHHNPKYDKETTDMLRAMIEKRKDKYEVIEQRRNIDRFIGLSVLQDMTYRYARKQLTGARLIVKNTGREGILLSEEQFHLIFKNIVAVTIGNNRLNPKELTVVYVITKESGDK